MNLIIRQGCHTAAMYSTMWGRTTKRRIQIAPFKWNGMIALRLSDNASLQWNNKHFFLLFMLYIYLFPFILSQFFVVVVFFVNSIILIVCVCMCEPCKLNTFPENCTENAIQWNFLPINLLRWKRITRVLDFVKGKKERKRAHTHIEDVMALNR